MEDEDLKSSVLESNLDNPNEEYGFTVEDWDDDEYTTPMQMPNTVFDAKAPVDFFNDARTDFGLSIASGIVMHGVKPICDAVMATSYGLTNLAVKGKFETPTAEEMQEDVTLLPKSTYDYEPKTMAGGIAKPIAGAAYGLAATSAGLGAVGLTGKAGIITNATIKGLTKSKDGIAVGKVLAPLINGIAANGLAFWEDEENLSNLLKPHVKNETVKSILDYMAVDKDDSFAERVMKQSIEGGFTGLAAEGIFRLFKGLKSGYKYIRGAKKIASETPESIVTQLRSPIVEKPETAEEIAEGVLKGTRIEPKNEAVQQVVKEVRDASQKLGITPEEIAIPRNPKPIDIQAAKNRVAAELIGDINIDNPEDLKRLENFLNTSQNTVEKTMGTLKAQEDTFIGGWLKLKALRKNAEKNGAVLSDIEKTNAMKDYWSKSAVARGKVEDVLNEGATAMGVSSKDNVHKANKAMLAGLEANLDEISTPELFDIIESAETEQELISKVNAFFANASDAVSKKGFDVKKLVALEQAGLMTSTDTLIRNATTSVENLTLGIADDFAESMINFISRDAVKNGADARQMVDIYKKGAAYVNYLGDSFRWGLYQMKRGVDKVAKSLEAGKIVPSSLPAKASPWATYRQSLPNKLTTNLPTEVGHTFSNEGNLGKMANSYIKLSGIGISEATDSFFDAGFYRGAAAARANSQARRLKKMYNLSDDAVKKIGDTMSYNLTNLDTTRRAYDVAEINEAILAGIEKSVGKKASKDAAVMTFREGQGMLTKGLTEAVNKIPFLKIFTPFVKTGSTIVFDRFIYDRTPYGLLYEGGKSVLGMLSPNIKSQLTNPALRNKFLSKQAVGASLMGYGTYLYANGKITGEYSSDPDIRRQQIASGWQPNSYVTKKDDGTLEFTSLNNLGVASMLLKYPAMIAGFYNDAMTKTANQEKINEVETAFMSNIMGMSLALGSAILDETVLRNVSNMFDRLDRGFRDEEEKKNFFINAATDPVKNTVPRILRQVFANKDYEELIQNNFDSLVKTFEGLPVKLDDFGDPIERADFTQGMLGFSVKKITPEERFKGIMAKFGMSTPGVQRLEFPSPGHSVRLDDSQMNKVKAKMGQLGVRGAIENIVNGMPSEMTEPVKEMYQNQINNTYKMYKKMALQSLVNEDEDIKNNYFGRIDFDVNEKYNVDRRVNPIPSLANF